MKRRRSVESRRMLDSRFIAASLLGDDMDHHRLMNMLGVLNGFRHLGGIVSVHRPQISEAPLLEKHARTEHRLDGVLRAADRIDRHRTLVIQGIVDLVPELQLARGRTDPVQICGETAHVVRDGMIVVIQQNNKIRVDFLLYFRQYI